MSKTNIAVIIYILGLIFAALFLNLWSAETGLKSLIGLAWTAIFLISLFYIDEKS
tara:strand:+ start:294 stop:458 length:165 start_codon:yes stop_codon:yes gene_type:complete